MPAKLRATLGLLAITVTALWALTVSYDISMADLRLFLFGSVTLLVGAAAAAILLVVCLKVVGAGVRWLARRLSRDDGDEG